MDHSDKPQNGLLEDLAADPRLHFERVVREYHAKLYKYLFKKTGNKEDAEDLVQNTMANALQALMGMPGEAILEMKLSPYLFTIAVNEFVNLCKYRQRLPTIPIDASEGGPLLELEADPNEQPAIAAEQDETLEMIESLPPPYREIAFLHFIEDLSGPKIAEMLDKPLNTVKSAIHRSKMLLRKTSNTQTKEKTPKKEAK